MRSNQIIILLFFITISSCGQSSKNQTNLTIEENEFGLVFTKNKRFVLENGEHKIDKESKVILFNKTDSLTMEEFDILTSNVESLYCHARVNYSLTPTRIENIADLLEWIHSIKSYKDLLIVPETRSSIRRIAEKYNKEELENGNIQHREFEEYISEILKKYVDIESIELKFYRK